MPLRGETQDSPDPWIFNWHGRYFLTHSSTRGVVLRSAPTIGGLAGARIRTLWPRPGVSLPPDRCCEFWAPEFHHLNGPHGKRWYVYSGVDDGNLNNHRVQVLESAGNSPWGPYAYKSILDLGDNYSIDPTVFRLGGHSYVLYSGAQGNIFTPTDIYIARLRNPWTIAGEPVPVSAPTEPWETEGIPINEGPEALLHGPWLHVIYSASWCALPTYKLGRITVRASANLLDPSTWIGAKAPQPVFQQDPARDVYGTGHGSFFTSPDGRQQWQVYHATDDPGLSCGLGAVPVPRTTRAQRIRWNSDGTPRFGRPVSLGADLAAPSGDPTLERQLEDAPIVFRSGATATRESQPHFAGEAGSTIAALRAGGSVTYRLVVPRAGRYRLLVRLGTGPEGGRIVLRIAGQSRARGTYGPAPRYPELNFGAVKLRKGKQRFRFILPAGVRPSGAETVPLDQIRFVRLGDRRISKP